MKIYFAGSIRGDDRKKEVFKKIISFLQSKGHTVLTEHVAQDNIAEKERSMTDNYIYNRDMKWLDSSDIVIAEVTGPSFGVGFEAAYAAERGKKVYLFYEKESEKKVSAMAVGNTHKNVKAIPYRGLPDIEKQLSLILSSA